MKRILLSCCSVTFAVWLHGQALYTTTLHGGTNGGGTICKLEQGKLTASFNFDRPDGRYPSGKLVQASDRKLYGLTSQGGKYNVGTLFSYHPATGRYTQLRDFDTATGASPQGQLLQADDGILYGTAGRGGTNNEGVLFSYNLTTGVYAKLVDFDTTTIYRPTGGLVQAANGKLYGTTSYGGGQSRGTIFSYQPATRVLEKVMDLDDSIGWHLSGSLLPARDGKLYGIFQLGGSHRAGTLFSVDPRTGKLTKLNDFTNSTGRDPAGGLTQGADGRLYGLMRAGGKHDRGVIFSYDPSTASFDKRKDLGPLTGIFPHGSLLQANDGNLYGTASMENKGRQTGIIFSFNPATGAYTVKPVKELNVYFPVHLTQASDGIVYGVSARGGSGRIGALYAINTIRLTYTKHKDFGVNDIGYEPRGPLAVDKAGVLYGITTRGGKYGKGVVFSFNPATAVYKKLQDCDDATRNYHTGGVLNAGNTKLYGGNPWGGKNFNGTLFSWNLATGKRKTEWQFTDTATGLQPQEHLLQASNGKLYGMTNAGGRYMGGVLFCFDPSTATYTRLQDLADSTGKNGYSGKGNLVEASDGKLYGMTNAGGRHWAGVLFSFDINTAVYTRLFDFSYESRARAAYRDLVQGSDGKLYGIRDEGGTHGNGVLFSYDLAARVYQELYVFISTEPTAPSFYMGEKPVGGLIKGADDKLYGIWKKRAMKLNTGFRIVEFYDPGGVYCFDPSTATFTKLQPFDSTTGLHPADTYFVAVPAKDSTNVGVKHEATRK